MFKIMKSGFYYTNLEQINSRKLKPIFKQDYYIKIKFRVGPKPWYPIRLLIPTKSCKREVAICLLEKMDERRRPTTGAIKGLSADANMCLEPKDAIQRMPTTDANKGPSTWWSTWCQQTPKTNERRVPNSAIDYFGFRIMYHRAGSCCGTKSANQIAPQSVFVLNSYAKWRWVTHGHIIIYIYIHILCIYNLSYTYIYSDIYICILVSDKALQSNRIAFAVVPFWAE